LYNISRVEKGLCLLKSLSWFERCNTVPQWIQIAVEKCKSYIKSAVADDEPIPVTNCVKFSRSARYAEGFLHQLGKFWENLEWPDPLMSSCYAVMIVNGIAECSEYYVSECGKKLGCIEEHFDDKKVSQKVSGLLLCMPLLLPYLIFFLSPSLDPPLPSLTLSLSDTHTPKQCSYAYSSTM
jgi:hypothetical protein